jgi:MerR family transcriptional regulator, light-induced transcriptional regulator
MSDPAMFGDQMRANDDDAPLDAGAKDAARVSQFASVVVSLLVERTVKQAAMPRDEIVQGFIAASLTGSEGAFDSLLVQLRKTRLSYAMLCDIYIPEAARRMGEAWTDGDMSWLDVSMGVARLQSLLREIGTEWAADRADDMGYGAVLMVVPEGEQHTLGPMVAMGQLRRMGLSVCLRIAPNARELSHLLDHRDFDGILISVATEARLKSAATLIRFFRSLKLNVPPIVLGGPIVYDNPQLAATAGADYSGTDIAAAMEKIGLNISTHDILRRA